MRFRFRFDFAKNLEWQREESWGEQEEHDDRGHWLIFEYDQPSRLSYSYQNGIILSASHLRQRGQVLGTQLEHRPQGVPGVSTITNAAYIHVKGR